VLKES